MQILSVWIKAFLEVGRRKGQGRKRRKGKGRKGKVIRNEWKVVGNDNMKIK